MHKTIIGIAIILAVASLLIGIRVNIQESQRPAMEERLTELVYIQSKIQKSLASLEENQKNILALLGRIPREAAPRPAGPTARPMPPQEDPNKVYDIIIGESPVKGAKDAKVTIVEFSDYQCPYSTRFHAVIPEVLAAYPKDVNYVLKNFPLGFHPQARPAVKAAFAAREQGKYWEMVELLFQNGRNLSEEKFYELASQIGLDVEKFKKDYKEKDAQWEKLIEADIALASSAAVRGTPTYFINGKKTRARDLNSFKQEIDAILQEKK